MILIKRSDSQRWSQIRRDAHNKKDSKRFSQKEEILTDGYK